MSGSPLLWAEGPFSFFGQGVSFCLQRCDLTLTKVWGVSLCLQSGRTRLRGQGGGEIGLQTPVRLPLLNPHFLRKCKDLPPTPTYLAVRRFAQINKEHLKRNLYTRNPKRYPPKRNKSSNVRTPLLLTFGSALSAASAASGGSKGEPGFEETCLPGDT